MARANPDQTRMLVTPATTGVSVLVARVEAVEPIVIPTI